MAHMMQFGKYIGVSLEEIALGKSIAGGKDSGYHYFYRLGTGDKKYFGRFQDNAHDMIRWNEIKTKLNNFKSVYPCVQCGDNATITSIAGDSRFGFSMGPQYICCNNDDCKRSLIAVVHNASLYPIKFDTILRFGWSAGNTKSDEKEVTKLMLELAGWEDGKRLTTQNATEFIDGL